MRPSSPPTMAGKIVDVTPAGASSTGDDHVAPPLWLATYAGANCGVMYAKKIVPPAVVATTGMLPEPVSSATGTACVAHVSPPSALERSCAPHAFVPSRRMPWVLT